MTEKDALPFINSQVWTVSDFLYEKLKEIQKRDEVKNLHYGHLPFAIIQFLKNGNNLYFMPSDFIRIENMILFCIKQENDGLYDKGGSCRGILNEKNTAFLDHFEKYLRMISKDRVVY